MYIRLRRPAMNRYRTLSEESNPITHGTATHGSGQSYTDNDLLNSSLYLTVSGLRSVRRGTTSGCSWARKVRAVKVNTLALAAR